MAIVRGVPYDNPFFHAHKDEPMNNKKSLRGAEWVLAKTLGVSLIFALKVLRHYSTVLQVPQQNNSVRLFFSDATNWQGIKDWMSKYYGIIYAAISFLVENKFDPIFNDGCVRAICSVRGGRNKSFLLGNTFVFFPPNTDDGNQHYRCEK